MSAQTDLLIGLMNVEFDGESFNGPSLMRTLRQLTPEQALATTTYEGYSVWAIALHVLSWKHGIALRLGAVDLPDFPYGQINWPAVPEDATDIAWQELLHVLEATHGKLVEVIATYDDDMIGATMPEWNMPFAKVLIWIATHDTYHTAQIRNMGVEGLPVTPP